MPLSFTNSQGYTVDVSGADIAITSPAGSTLHVPFPEGNFKENGTVWWPTYAFNVAGNESSFCLIYTFERDEIGGNAAQFYAYDGSRIGEEIWVTSQTNQGHRPSVWDLQDGRYIFLWQTNNPIGYPAFTENMVGYVVGRVIDANTRIMQDTFVIATGTNLLKDAPSIEVSETGAVSIFWTEYDLGGAYLDTYQSIYGGEINELIQGTLADDYLYGLGGNDTINGYQGNDTVLMGDGSDIASGGTGNDTLDGGMGADTLVGGAGDDSVSAGAGNDTIVGGHGAGNDTYTGGEGMDTVKYTSAAAAITVNLATGAAGSTAGGDMAGIGTDQLALIESVIAGRFDDRLIGDGGANTLDGWKGADSMLGGAGNDVYILDNPGDRVFETVDFSASSGDAGGIDTVRSSVTASLNAYAGVRLVEKLVLTGGGNINGTGNALANTLIGNAGANSLSGLGGKDLLRSGGGNDVLNGGLGGDTLDGGAGQDTFRFTTSPGESNVDSILGFVAADDTIQLDDAVFAALGSSGLLATAAFVIGEQASDPAHRIMFNSVTGALLYDADGSGDGAAVQIATLSSVTGTLSAADFMII